MRSVVKLVLLDSHLLDHAVVDHESLLSAMGTFYTIP